MTLGRANGWIRGCGSAPLGLVLFLAGAGAAIAQDAGDPAEPQSPASSPAYVAMTGQERWQAYVHDNYTSPAAAIGFFGSAALGQLSHDTREWGLGAQGYWHRVGNHVGRAAIRGSIESGLAAALHYDIRYQRMPGASGLARTRHALRRTLFTRNQEGKSVVDVPALAGIYGGDMLSTFWHPRRYTPFGSGLRGGNFGLGFQAAGNLAKEFGPDLKHLILRK